MTISRNAVASASLRARFLWALVALLLAFPSLQGADKVRFYPMGEEDPDGDVGEVVTETADIESGPTVDVDGNPVFDSGGEFVPLVAAGDPIYVEGREGPGSLAIEFDGEDDTLTSAPFDPRNFAGSFTSLSQAWVKPDSDSQGRRQSVWSLGNDNGGVGISADGRWELIASSIIPDTVSNAAVEFDEWTHVAVIRGGNGAEVYINGSLVVSGANFWNGVGNVTVGHRTVPGGAGPTFFDGAIDDFNVSGFSDQSFDPAVDLDAIDPDAFSGVAGDVDQDGDVDKDDYDIWSINVGFDNGLGAGDGPSLLLGDVDQNGRINYFDFQIITDLAGAEQPPDDPRDPDGVIVAEDFLYHQPTKELGPGGGFTLQDYGGGESGPAGAWNGRWVSVGNAIITGSGFDLTGTATPCIAADDTMDPPVPPIELDLADQQFAGYTTTGLSLSFLQRAYDVRELEVDAIYFAARVLMFEENTPMGRLYLSSPGEEESGVSIGFEPGVGFSATLGFATQFSIDSTLDPDVYHQLVGRLEVNVGGGVDDILTVWLNPTGEEEADEEVHAEFDVIDTLDELTGEFRLDRGTVGCGPIFWDDVAVGTTWDSVVTLDVPRLELLVDEMSGAVSLVNNSATDFALDFIELSSAVGSLNAVGWNGLADQGVVGWERNRSDANRLTESNAAGFTTLAAGSTLALGAAFLVGAAQDLEAHVGTRQGLLNVVLPAQKRAGFRRGDDNADGGVDISDPIANLSFQFLGMRPGDFCLDAMDFNDDGRLDLSDPIANLSHQFLGEDPPPAPGNESCGEDPTPDDKDDTDPPGGPGDELGCESYPSEKC